MAVLPTPTKNWKTTALGLAGAIFYAATGTHDYKHVGMAVLVAALGYFASDAKE
jgi:hypothetical protein